MTAITLTNLSLAPNASFQDRRGNLLTLGAQGTVTADSAVHNLVELAQAGFDVPLSAKSGPTSARPAVSWPGQVFFDTSLGVAVRRNLANGAWLDACGVVV